MARALLKLERGAAIVPQRAATPATASLFIVNPFGTAERVAQWFSTHPLTAERVKRLRELARVSTPVMRGNSVML